MANVNENIDKWNHEYDWKGRGEEWSIGWGGSESQWFHTLYPRIRAFVPAGTILEIAPGFGRWTRFLKDLCSKLVVVDLAETCINACKQRFQDSSHITYHVNDGRSLAMVPDSSIDFVFSFDSLVHVELDVIDAYVSQLARKLKPDGVGFFHHSNIAVYSRLLASGQLTNDHWRAQSVSAEGVRACCEKAGLVCIGQELINWAQDQYLTDCLSTFTPRESSRARHSYVLQNLNFMWEATLASKLAPLYNREAQAREKSQPKGASVNGV